MIWILESLSGIETEYDDFSMAYWAGLEQYGDGNFRIVKKESEQDARTPVALCETLSLQAQR